MKLTELFRENVVQNQWPISALTGGLKGVIGVDITANGSGYASVPTVSGSGGGGSGFTAVAVLDAQRVVRVLITSPGTGFSSAPTLSFGGPGTGAAAQAIIGPISLDALPTTLLQTGAVVRVEIQGRPMLYKLTAGTDAETPPTVIRPDDYHGTTNARVWKLVDQDAAGTIIGTGGTYSFTNTLAYVGMGLQKVLPSAGTYLLVASIHVAQGATSNDPYEFQFRNSTDGAFVGASVLDSVIESGQAKNITLITVAAFDPGKTVQVWGRNTAAARGSASDVRSSLTYVRLF